MFVVQQLVPRRSSTRENHINSAHTERQTVRYYVFKDKDFITYVYFFNDQPKGCGSGTSLLQGPT